VLEMSQAYRDLEALDQPEADSKMLRLHYLEKSPYKAALRRQSFRSFC
jgi:hypothetical protein